MVARKETTPTKTKNCASEAKSPGGWLLPTEPPQLRFSWSVSRSLHRQRQSSLSRFFCIPLVSLLKFDRNVILPERIVAQVADVERLRRLRRALGVAGDGVFHVGGEVGAGGEGADGEEPLQDAHEAARLLQHARVHHSRADGLRKGQKRENHQSAQCAMQPSIIVCSYAHPRRG